MELALSILGIVISLAIAWTEHMKAKRAEARLEAIATTLPEKLLSGVRAALNDQFRQGSDDEGWSTPAKKTEKSPWLQTRYADLNADGQDELLISMPSGAHASILLVYGFASWEFEKIAELTSTTPHGFEIEDEDGDGKLRIATVEIAKRPELPYVFGLRDRVTYSLVNNEFVEVSRVEGWDDADLERITLEQNAIEESRKTSALAHTVSENSSTKRDLGPDSRR